MSPYLVHQHVWCSVNKQESPFLFCPPWPLVITQFKEICTDYEFPLCKHFTYGTSVHSKHQRINFNNTSKQDLTSLEIEGNHRM